MTSEASPSAITRLWYRDDLRVIDHEALSAARADGDVVALQRARFDPDGTYVGEWVPESKDQAETASARGQSKSAGGRSNSGGSFAPIVDLGESRLEALAAYEAMKNG